MEGKYQSYKEYKESGSKWVDNIPANWKVVSLKHILSIPITDGPHLTPKFLDEGVPFVSAEAVSGGYVNFDKIRGFISEADDEIFSQKYRPQRHDVYMIKSGATTGITAIVETDQRFNIWSPLAVMRCKDIYNPYFLLNYLRSNSFQKSVQLSWTFGTQQNIGMGTLENLTVCFPPFDEQEKIANFLDHETAQIDTLIEKQQRLIKLLKEKRQAVISHAVTKGLNPNAPMRDSGVEWLAEVPEHWLVGRYKFCTSRIVVGIAEAATHAYAETGVPIIRSTNIREEGLDISGMLFIKEEFAEKNDSKYLYANDVITVRTGYPGTSAVIPEELDKSQCFTNLISTPKKNIIPAYLSEYLNSHTGKSYFDLLGWGSAQKNISVPILQNVPIAWPDESEQSEIMNYVQRQRGRYTHLVGKAEEQIILLHERRTALISAAVTGKIDVRNWQAPEPSDNQNKEVAA